MFAVPVPSGSAGGTSAAPVSVVLSGRPSAATELARTKVASKPTGSTKSTALMRRVRIDPSNVLLTTGRTLIAPIAIYEDGEDSDSLLCVELDGPLNLRETLAPAGPARPVPAPRSRRGVARHAYPARSGQPALARPARAHAVVLGLGRARSGSRNGSP